VKNNTGKASEGLRIAETSPTYYLVLT